MGCHNYGLCISTGYDMDRVCSAFDTMVTVRQSECVVHKRQIKQHNLNIIKNAEHLRLRLRNFPKNMQKRPIFIQIYINPAVLWPSLLGCPPKFRTGGKYATQQENLFCFYRDGVISSATNKYGGSPESHMYGTHNVQFLRLHMKDVGILYYTLKT